MPMILNPKTKVLERRSDKEIKELNKTNPDYNPKIDPDVNPELRKMSDEQYEKYKKDQAKQIIDKNKGDGKRENDKLISYIKPSPIDNYDDAMSFARREWGKIQRDNGHTCNVKVVGYNEFQVGKWCAIYSPQMGTMADMYINSVDHTKSPSDEWVTVLELTDFPPSFSEDDTMDKLKKSMEQYQNQKIKDNNDPTNTPPAENPDPHTPYPNPNPNLSDPNNPT